ncbi:uncharacterized protein LOC116845314 [Odontomachus brunneus]|uniref:uncharacterized protein LOC116845314 n=1 Tax=Odontomachus brunneus TaxID=486640 RepID=UPI0013F275E7|nr:uncharacterized protein LOC116845314 [Odontomachus brunneus]XP_032673728.1 uncharacterized protein LOC116845314 [Odontomachus brunneus]XP_032673729.1 uncharacterized protein LOC116845314 [Odontomachus brunneus]XP_032673730.1 uncharacterized protein LOC116845314 [Odontomachus brunneus]
MLDFDNVKDIGSKYRAPLIKTPVTDLFMQSRNLQFTSCAPYELMYIDCMEAYGYHQGNKKCRMIMNDMYECVFRVKRMMRVFAMHHERDRQFRNGERKEHYPPGPPLDMY